MNLVSNAVKFTRNGGITLRLESLDGGLPGAVVLTVSDTGPGIEASRRQEIFEPFSQGTATSSQAGSGLGLAIVRDLSRHMNGDASVVERPGGGSVFQVTLVIPTVLGSGEGPEDLLAIPPVAYPVAENPQPGRGLTVLVCEDDAVSQRVIAAMLDKLGHRATIAASAEEALEILERQTFDILVTDLRLPGIDGLELAKHVRNGKTGGDRKLPIIAATAETSRDETARLLAAGIDGHLQKPFMIPDLDRALRAATEVRLRESPGAPSSPFTRPV
jgi:CheY-like chemotaxis protein